MTNDAVLNIRLPNSLAERLVERSQRTLVPTAAFVRRCIEHGLEQAVVEAEQVSPTEIPDAEYAIEKAEQE